MSIKIEFDYHSVIVFIPDGYIDNVCKLQEKFLEWVEEQPNCIIKDSSGVIVLAYDEKDFLKYINEVVLQNTNEKAYFVQNKKQIKVNRTIKF